MYTILIELLKSFLNCKRRPTYLDIFCNLSISYYKMYILLNITYTFKEIQLLLHIH